LVLIQDFAEGLGAGAGGAFEGGKVGAGRQTVAPRTAAAASISVTATLSTQTSRGSLSLPRSAKCRATCWADRTASTARPSNLWPRFRGLLRAASAALSSPVSA